MLRMQISKQQELIARSEEEAARSVKEETKDVVEMVEYNGIMIPKDQLKQMQLNALHEESHEEGGSIAQISKHGSQPELTDVPELQVTGQQKSEERPTSTFLNIVNEK